MALVHDFPLFPLQLVALPSELIPLHIFEERYKTMIARCLEEESEFGIVWMADDGLRPIGCACEIAEVLERMPDGRLNLIARGTRPFRIEARQEELAYPAGTVEFLADRDEPADDEAAEEALLDLPSESGRRRLVPRLFRAAIKRLDFIERAQARARSNGKVHFSA